MSTQRHHTLRGKNWTCNMTKDRLVDVFVAGFTVLWLLLTFATIQQQPSKILPLLAVALAIGLTGILLLNGHRINYLEIGNWTVVDMYNRRDRERENQMTDEERERHR